MHVITVIQHNYVIVEAVVVVVTVVAAVERVVHQVDITIINHGMDPMVVPVVICGPVIIKVVVVPVVVMNVTNNQLVPATVIVVNRIRVGGTIQHETKIKISNIPPCDA